MIGGQAVVEGVLMRSDRRWALSVRAPDGSIQRTGGDVVAPALANVPLLRGLAAIGSAFRMGLEAIRWSVGVASGEGIDRRAFRRSSLIALAIVVVVFVAAPSAAGDQVGSGSTLVETLLRFSLVIAYLVGVGQLAPVRRVFQYHGAEHMAVSALEAGDPLEVGSARRHSMLHPRCGTTFIIVVALLSGVVHAVLEWQGMGLIASRVVGLPLAVGLGYELLRATATSTSWLSPLRAVLTAAQHLTVRAPDDEQLEVALDALRAVSGDTARVAS